MDFLNLLVPKEKIVGIEITDEKLRMLYLEKDTLGAIKTAGKSEEDMEEGVVEFSAVKDRAKLSKALASLRKKFKPRRRLSNFAIVTIPQIGVYSEIFDFPENLDGDQMVEAIGFSAAANLPLPLAECYMDWQAIESGNAKKKVLVSLIAKKTADSYIEILKENGFHLIALEPYFLSIARSVEIPDDPVIFLNLTTEGVTSVVYSKKAPYFSQFEFWSEVSRGKEIRSADDFAKIIKAKVKKIKSYFESRQSDLKIKKILFLVCGADAKEIIKSVGESEIKFEEARLKIPAAENCEWASVAGAAMRAFVPRSEDTIISLLPVGTEDFYEIKKAESFAKSVLFLVFSLAVFYIAVFAAMFVFISFQERNISRQLELRSNALVPPEYARKERETKEFNGFISDLEKTYSVSSADYAAVLQNIGRLNTSGITLASVNFTNPAGPIAASGMALERQNLNAFKFQMENSDNFINAKFSVQNIAQKNNIPFSVTFFMKQ